MVQTKKDLFIKNIFSTVAPTMDFLNAVFSLGLCHVWRRKAVTLSKVQKDDKVLDVCTGTGDLALILMEKMGSEGSFTGIDFCQNMLDLAKIKMKKKAKTMPGEVSFIEGDAKELVFPDNSFDLVTVAFGMRNIPDTFKALEEIKRVLKPGGRFMCLELTMPTKKWFVPFYKWYTLRVMPIVAKYVVKKMTPFAYLPRSIIAFYPSQEFTHIIGECGFSDVAVHPMTMGVATVFTAQK